MRSFIIATTIGIVSFIIFLSYGNVADYDIWARFVQGSYLWNHGKLIDKDIFAFTEVLPHYLDHEWGSGAIFFSFLRIFGSKSLLLLKIAAAILALIIALWTGRLLGASRDTLLILAIPCAVTILPAYTDVVRSHVFTYLFFSVTIFCLEKIRVQSKKWPVALIPVMMALWANLHGGFVSGLCVMALYAAESFLSHKYTKRMMTLTLFSILATFVNPYGAKLWEYLIFALTLSRKYIIEWDSLPLGGLDVFTGFRILSIIAVILIAAAWKKVRYKGKMLHIVLMASAIFITLCHRRHAPFFGLVSAAFLGPYLEAIIGRFNLKRPILLVYAVIAWFSIWRILPLEKFEVVATQDYYPVKEVDILAYSKLKGNLVVPLHWGNYAMWRLYPNIKISICGRYEAMYTESTFEMNMRFFCKEGSGWDEILRLYPVDYIIIDRQATSLEQADLEALGFEIVSLNSRSILLARKNAAPLLRQTAANLPKDIPTPLDWRVSDKWR